MHPTPADFILEEQGFDPPGAPGCVGWRCRFDEARYADALFASLGVPFPPALDPAVARRRAEFLAGRHAALRAMARLGLGPAEVPVGRHREPVWPAGIVGSITHQGDRAACLLSADPRLGSLGIDLADWIPEDIARSIQDLLLAPAEKNLLARLPLPPERGLTMAFSAKESLFKALYPYVGAHFGFHCAAVEGVDLAGGTLVLRLVEHLSGAAPKGAGFTAAVTTDDQGVFSHVSVASPSSCRL